MECNDSVSDSFFLYRTSTYNLFRSYNRVNGTHVSENPYIIRDILRKEWGFEGLTMSDW